MALEIRPIGADDGELLRTVIDAQPHPLVYHGRAYGGLLEAVTGGEPAHLAALRGGEAVGVLLAYRSPDRGAGRVANSLPYYGSHGGPVPHPALPEAEQRGVNEALTEAFFDDARANDCIAATMIDPPFGLVRDGTPASDCQDGRIGQIALLPDALGGGHDDDALMRSFHGKTRNAIRKARKLGIETRAAAESERGALAALHAATMARIGATPKSDAFFAAVEAQFGAAHAPILLAEHEGALIGALLLLRGGGWVEYFVPASDPELRQLQPMSLLVHHAMRDAVERGERYFNFGGTWESQTEVYRFKARFGAKDHPYRYWTRLYRPVDRFRALGKDGLLDAFPGFYVLPFDLL